MVCINFQFWETIFSYLKKLLMSHIKNMPRPDLGSHFFLDARVNFTRCTSFPPALHSEN